MKRVINLLSAMTLFALSFATIQPAIASGLSFDYTVGGHFVNIVDGLNNHRTWSEGTENPTTSFNLDGSGLIFQPLDVQRYNTDQIRSASAVFGNASLGTMGVKAKAVDTSKLVHAEVQHAAATVQMGGAFIIAGPTGTVDLKVLTTLDGVINVALQQGISGNSMTIINFDMTATSQNYGNYFSSYTEWSICSLSGLDEGGNPYEEGLYQSGMSLLPDRISTTVSYEFNNYELILTLPAVKTNQLFNLDLVLNASIVGPDLYGTIGDEVDFFSTYGMGFTNSSNPNQWFELPEGYSISAASAAPIPEPTTLLLL